MLSLLCATAAHAVAAVRDCLYRKAGMEIPSILRGDSTTRSVRESTSRGTADILHLLKCAGEEDHVCTAHEVKRSRVLEVASVHVLEHLVSLANVQGAGGFERPKPPVWKKKLGDSCARTSMSCSGSAIPISSSSAAFIASMIRPTKAVICLLTGRRPYPPSGVSSISAYRVTVPAFSPRLFQPHDALLCNGHLVHTAGKERRTRNPSALNALGSQVATKRRKEHKGPYVVQTQALSAPMPRTRHLDFSSRGSCRHDGDIVISFGRLVFGLFQAHIVAKAAYRSSASDRLLHEFAVYNFLRTLQGIAIPSLFGLYRNLNDGSSILLTSYAGVTLTDFDNLRLKDRQKLLSHIIRLHQAGVQHNDMEPRNVTLSPRLGPFIIDFDNATLGHMCTGLSCKELCQMSNRLGLDLNIGSAHGAPVLDGDRVAEMYRARWCPRTVPVRHEALHGSIDGACGRRYDVL
ncbi:hypothetical protein B0H19DRAFT_1083172 [Mycena capillaripes]|nr:hypothetical protein B0H19DRAFT_1083172 [Mycena capillaripes]